MKRRKRRVVNPGSPDTPEIAKLFQEGLALHRQGKLGSAKQIYEKILQKQSNHFDSLNRLGTIYAQVKQYGVSLHYFDRALQISKTNATVFNNRGIVLKALKRLDDALMSYDKALHIKPDYVGAMYNRGNVLQELKRFDDALMSYDEVLRVKPDYVEALYNRGNAFQEIRRFDDALKSYDEVLRIKPDHADATLNKSMLLILIGNYSDGWKLYEARLQKEDTKNNYPRYPKLAWRGQEDISGKRILIQSEQGLGDSIQFIRYLEKINLLGAEIFLEVPRTLANLVKTIETPITLIDKGSKLPDFDAYCPLLSLPYTFKTTAETIPSAVPYLFADKQKVAGWNSRLGEKTRKRIGLVWSGSTEHKNDHNRSIPLEFFEDLLKLPIEWHSLQKEYRTEDKIFLDSHPEVIQHQDELGDFMDTAALIECMDLVISVDTSIAHLAGALAKTTWILLPFTPDFRWMLDRTDCPWYPTAKLLRQDDDRDWKNVIMELSKKL